MGIRGKITLPYLALAVLLAFSAGYVISQFVFDTLEERFSSQLVESGKLAAERMVIEEDRLLSTFRLLAYTEGVAEAMQKNDPDALRSLTFGVIVNNQEEAVEFLGADGSHLLAVHHRIGGQIEEYEFSSAGSTVIQWDIVQKVYAQEIDNLGDKYSDFVRTEWGDYFYVAGPVYAEDNRLAGVVLVGKTADSLVRKLREETLAQVTFYGHDGSILASTFINPQSLPPVDAKAALIIQDSASFRRENNRDVTVQNISYEEILGPWEGRGDADLGVLGIGLAKSFLVNASEVTRLKAMGLVAVMLGLVVLIGMYLAYSITRPIRQLVAATQQVSRGNLTVQLEPSSRDEMAVLTSFFNQMVKDVSDAKNQILDSYDETLLGWSKALELRDKETKGHTMRVVDLTVRVARQMGIPENKMEHVRRGALLHDIGKMGIPDAILSKPGRLDHKELAIMREHPAYAYEMLKGIDYLQHALNIPYCHHEHWDGNGYPRGLKGDAIPLEARIFALIDAWDALTHDRPYREALPEEEAAKVIRGEIGTHFDPMSPRHSST